MKPNDLLGNLLLGLVGLFCVGCQQLSDEASLSADDGMLKVRARSAENVEIVYPVYLYAFAETGECSDSQVMERAGDKMEFRLTPGSYRIVAVSGLSEAYLLPAHPSIDDVIQLEDAAGADSPLMVGKADVVITSEADATLEVTLAYAVAAVRVSLSGVPASVTGVTTTMSSCYTTLSMDGVYGGEARPLALVCAKDSMGVWNSDMRYVFPGSAKETVFSIVLKEADGTETAYGYTWQGVLQANHPFLINGNYSGGITVGGSLIVKGWETATEVDFDFGGGASEGEDAPEEPEAEVASLPEVGSIWNGAIVADVVSSDDTGADLLLMSLDEWTATTSEMDDLLSSYSSNGIADWRLPDYDEAKLLRETFCGDDRLELNERISQYDSALYGIDGEERYLCDKEGMYYSFVFSIGTSITQAGSKRSYYVRLVKTYRVTVEDE